jgi:epoxyqueuosine reductase
VAAGNALRQHDDATLREALRRAGQGADALVVEHIAWALSAPAAAAALSSAPLTNGAPA